MDVCELPHLCSRRTLFSSRNIDFLSGYHIRLNSLRRRRSLIPSRPNEQIARKTPQRYLQQTRKLTIPTLRYLDRQNAPPTPNPARRPRHRPLPARRPPRHPLDRRPQRLRLRRCRPGSCLLHHGVERGALRYEEHVLQRGGLRGGDVCCDGGWWDEEGLLECCGGWGV